MKPDLSPVLPGVPYDRGFLQAGKPQPFWDLVDSGRRADNWSDEMADSLAEWSRDHFIDRYNRSIAVAALRPVLATPGARAIDVGCAAGYLLSDLTCEFPRAEIFGADFVGHSLQRCHQNYPDIPLLRMDLTQTRLPDALFDGISCLNVLEHIQHDDQALRELGRMLKPSGRIVITVPAAPHLYDFLDELHFHVQRYDRSILEKRSDLPV